jgi:RNA recognition motif-containing protein
MDLNDVGAQLDPENDEVFISGLPTDTTEQDIADYFGQIGIIKQVHGIRMSEA